jgi:hypothetical protein
MFHPSILLPLPEAVPLSPSPHRWKEITPVERPRSTLLPALGAGLKRLVEGGSSILKPPEKGDKMGTQNYLATYVKRLEEYALLIITSLCYP